MTVVQIVVTVFVFFACVRLVTQLRNRAISVTAFLLWLLLWLAVVTVFWMPELASRLAVAVGIGRGADLVVYLSVIVVFYVLYRLFVRIEHVERDITAIARTIAMNHEHKKDSSGDSHPEL